MLHQLVDGIAQSPPAEVHTLKTTRLGLSLAYSRVDAARYVKLARHAEALGYDSVWTAEAYGADAVVPLTWMAAHTSRIRLGTGIMQIPARTPAMTGMTASTLDELSGGRMLLGVGASGPQVAEGWHGEPYANPLGRTREYVEIIRRVLRREQPLDYHGAHYDIPYRGPGSTGLGVPLKSILHPRSDIPIYLAAIGPQNVRLATEIADGFLPAFFSPTLWHKAFGEALEGVAFEVFDVAPSVSVALGEDVQACRDLIKPQIALYLGGMGARGQNFYNDLAKRFGFEEAAERIQDLYLDGKQKEAIAAVPDELVDEVALAGPPARIAERFDAWKNCPATTLVLNTTQSKAMELMAELAL
jgi:F420-dependent oxidoreductase-like protein